MLDTCHCRQLILLTSICFINTMWHKEVPPYNNTALYSKLNIFWLDMMKSWDCQYKYISISMGLDIDMIWIFGSTSRSHVIIFDARLVFSPLAQTWWHFKIHILMSTGLTVKSLTNMRWTWEIGTGWKPGEITKPGENLVKFQNPVKPGEFSKLGEKLVSFQNLVNTWWIFKTWWKHCEFSKLGEHLVDFSKLGQNLVNFQNLVNTWRIFKTWWKPGENSVKTCWKLGEDLVKTWWKNMLKFVWKQGENLVKT